MNPAHPQPPPPAAPLIFFSVSAVTAAQLSQCSLIELYIIDTHPEGGNGSRLISPTGPDQALYLVSHGRSAHLWDPKDSVFLTVTAAGGYSARSSTSQHLLCDPLTQRDMCKWRGGGVPHPCRFLYHFISPSEPQRLRFPTGLSSVHSPPSQECQQLAGAVKSDKANSALTTSVINDHNQGQA
ncbi:hypothetical protein Baya_12538 [Bagarius yarrelli]|uniref:Uncharacterized protein n=1 Tax=Bagarius yarrelli TaxID=175774 RepID=A0A556V3H9_BAGYA|nr:hypothetical protein Baya_12538 [Bagarius yarrelli]